MNEQTVNLLNTLSAKLGTTSEFLWGVLVRQALIDGWVSIFQYGILLLGWYAVYKVLKNGKAVFDWAERHDLDIVFVVSSIVSCIILVVLTIAAFCYIPMVFSAFLNPDYWALHEILSHLPRK
jgi:hypothetical protein